MDEQPAVGYAASNGASARPGLLRARSDFGPRLSAPPPESADEASVDGHFKIRHGWDDQLNSEEYSNLLTSVRRVSQQPGT
jgi:regulator-associated protein of mTOR